MRTFPAAFLAALNDIPDIVLLIDLYLRTTHRLTSSPFVISANEGFSSSVASTFYDYSPGDFLAISPPVYTSYTERDLFSIEVADTSGEIMWEIHRGITGKRVLVRFGILQDGSNRVVDDYLFIVYSGYIDRPRFDFSTQARKVTLECTSPTGNLLSNVSYPFTKEGRKLVNKNDTSFDNLKEDKDFSEQFSTWGQAQAGKV